MGLENNILRVEELQEFLGEEVGLNWNFWTSLTLVALVVGLVWFFYWCWWKFQVRKLKIVNASSNSNHVAIAVVVILSVLKNNVTDSSVMFFQLLRGLVVIHQSLKLGLFYIWTGFRPVVIGFSPDIFEAILKNPIQLKKSFDYSFLSLWLKDGLVTSDGHKWKQRRRIITSTFHFRILGDFVTVFHEQSRRLVQHLKQDVHKDWIDVVPRVTMCTLDIICETAMGIRINAQEGHSPTYVKSMHKVCEAFATRVMRPWLWPKHIYFMTGEGREFKKHVASMDVFTREVIRNRKQELLQRKTDDPSLQKEKERKAFLDLLLDMHIADPLSITEDDIQEEVDSFMFAGHDTTAVGISWVLYLLGLYPRVQKKVHEEVNAVLGVDPGRTPTEKDLKELKYLECVIKESQRLYPSAPYIGRELSEDVHIHGCTLPKGTTCMLIIHALHRNPESFPHPEVFDPDRFLPENSIGRHPFAYCPFSAGPRSCIGQRFAMLEEKVVIANLIREFHISSVDQRDQLHLAAELVLRSKKGIRLKVESR